jgi:anion-transporting  ArsA/GET3 family ATPase
MNEASSKDEAPKDEAPKDEAPKDEARGDESPDTLVGRLIDSAEVIVCCGSGGVGKTTTAAVLGIEAARRGRRVVVVTIDPARRLADALGLGAGLSGDPQVITLPGAQRVASTGELWAMMLDTPAMFDKVVRENAVDDEQADRIVQNRFYRNMVDALSGTQEFMASEALHELHGDERFDLVIVDTPPSRNALDFLDAPGVLTRFLDHRAFKLLMLPTRTGLKVLSAATQPLLKAIGRVVGSEVLADTVAFFQSFAGMESGFRDRADAVGKLLREETTKFVLVASPQHDTVVEAVWFAEQLVAHEFVVSAAVVNRVQPSFGDGTVADAVTRSFTATERGDHDAAALWANLAELRIMANAHRGELAPLRAAIGVDAMVEVPQLATDVHDLEALEAIAQHLFSR